MRVLPAVFVLMAMAGCEAPGFAPIRDVIKPESGSQSRPPAKPAAQTPPPSVQALAARPREVVVKKGDTLFAIAFENGLDYRDLAFWNNLSSPDLIQVGQVLRLTPPPDLAKSKGVEVLPMKEVGPLRTVTLKEPPLLTEPKAVRLPYTEANWAMLAGQEPKETIATDTASRGTTPVTVPSEADDETNGEWRWPADGQLIGRYGEEGGKGINIAGERQSPVFSAAPGKVVYSGSGLRGYGKLVIIKHAGEYLTAYAHNHAVLVREGQWVKGGQKIAEMGDTESDRIMLHFEIRQYGKPVDPLKILPERK